MPFENTQYRGNHFPGVAWSKGPAGTKSYAVMMQGALGKETDDATRNTSIHFNMYNIPAAVTKLDAGLKTAPAGAFYGSSLHGTPHDYVGPHTHNFSLQPYHLQVLALDIALPDKPDMSLADVEALAAGHVLASGEIVGLATMDPDSQEAKDFKAGKKPATADE